MFFEDRSLAPYQGDEPYLFLSYSHKDSEKVSELIRVLNQNGFRVWYDEGITPGVDWDDNVAQAIVNCSYFVALISPNYTESENCRDELNYARELKKQRLLVYLEETKLPPGIEMRVSHLLALHMDKYADAGLFYDKLFEAEGIDICRGKPEAAESVKAEPEQAAVKPETATAVKLPQKPVQTTYAVTPERKKFSFLVVLIPAVILLVLVLVFLPGRLKKGSAQTEAPAPTAETETTSLPAEPTAEPTEPSPTTTPEPTPTPTPSPTPTPTPTPTPEPPSGEELARMEAEALYEDGKTAAAALAYWKLGDKDRSRELWREAADHQAVGIGDYHAVGLKSDGTVLATGDNSKGQLNVRDWTDIVAVAAGEYHTLGLKADGTVVAAGMNSAGECKLDSWTDIIAIAAGCKMSFGLKSDGTVMAAGVNNLGQMSVGDWTDIVAIATSRNHTVGLKADGTVVATGANENGQCNVKDWTDIVAIAVSCIHTVGLKSDGTVVAVGNNDRNACEVSSWRNIQTVAATTSLSIGLREDGTLIWSGQQGYSKDLSGWIDIHEIRGCSGWGEHWGIIGVTEFGNAIAELVQRVGNVSDWYGLKLQ